MSTIARIILTAVLGVSIFTAAPAAADTYQPVCVQDTDGKWFAYVIETQADLDWIGDRRVEPFPNSAVGCGAYGELKGAPEIPAEPEPCTPVVRYVDRVIETSSVQTVEDTRRVEQLQRKVTRQQALIRKLRAKLARR